MLRCCNESCERPAFLVIALPNTRTAMCVDCAPAVLRKTADIMERPLAPVVA